MQRSQERLASNGPESSMQCVPYSWHCGRVLSSVMKRIERIRLYPTPHQQQRLNFMLDVTRQLYNALLEQRRDAYRKRGLTDR
jgi:hypothetical protein